MADQAPSSRAALANLRALLARLGVEAELEVIDDTARARADGVVVTSMLLRLAPRPVLRAAGDLSDEATLRRALEPSA